MVKKWVDRLSVRFCGYDDLPLPENLQEAWEERVTVHGEIDRDALMSEIEDIFSPNVSRIVADTYDSTAWGRWCLARDRASGFNCSGRRGWSSMHLQRDCCGRPSAWIEAGRGRGRSRPAAF